jgi:redox-sensitive bicupin YhaK (pirin superfamily)
MLPYTSIALFLVVVPRNSAGFDVVVPALGLSSGRRLGTIVPRRHEPWRLPASVPAAAQPEGVRSVERVPSSIQPTVPYPPLYRQVRRVEKFARLPVWPVWNGVFLWLVGNVLGAEAAAKLEHQITGRVCPNFFAYAETNPYVMLVHHCHSFSNADPLRFLQRTFFPEGFPAHPHRGFVTITYILHGGFVHRDSVGIRQSYGTLPHHRGKHTQWLTTGRGLLHEEMFDLTNSQGLLGNSRQELFQIWLNVPSRHKFDEPQSLLLGDSGDQTPLVEEDATSTTRVIAGTYQNRTAAAPTRSDLALFHVTLHKQGASWTFDVPKSHQTLFIYVRQGSLSALNSTSQDFTTTATIPAHSTAYFTSTGDSLTVTATASSGADFMVLSGAPIPEPCVASGSMVMTSHREIEQAYSDYQMGQFGVPWDHTLSDEQWQRHVQQHRPPQ